MRRLIVVFAVMLIGLSGTCFGRKLADPDTLTFKKTYSMPGMNRDELYRFVKGWPDMEQKANPMLVGFMGRSWIKSLPTYSLWSI